MRNLLLLTVILFSSIMASSQFGPQQEITQSTAYPSDVKTADLDGDGDMDVLSTSSIDRKIAWYENDGSGNFGRQNIISTSANGAWSVHSTDIDGDGDMDVISASTEDDKIAWYENDGNGNFGGQNIISTSADGALSVYSTDLDGDGDMDVLSASLLDSKIAWYENDGNGNFGEQNIISTSALVTRAVFSIDLDGDGDMDVLSASEYDDKIAWYKNEGNGNFGGQNIISTSADGAMSVYSTDIDGDGDMDVLSASRFDNKIAWYENDGSGNFGGQNMISTSAGGARSVSSTDIDGDGDMDIIGAGRALYDDIAPGNPGVVKIYLNDGLGNYTQHIGIDVFAGVKFSALALEDVDQDLDLDLILTGDDFWGEELSTYYMNDGSGNFSENGWVELNGVFRGTVDFADVNGDSYMDLLITGSTGEESIATLYTTDENGIFTEVMDTPFYGVSIGSAAFADIDGDNDIDLVISGQDAGFDPSTRLYLNNLNPSTHVDNSSDKSHLVSVFPTSYSATTTITCLGEFEYKVIDSMGKEVLEGISTDSQILNMHGFASGYYIIQVINGATIQSFKSYKL